MQVLYDISHANLVLYGATIPSYDTDKDNKETEDLEWGGNLDYDNPNNFTDISEDRKRI